MLIEIELAALVALEAYALFRPTVATREESAPSSPVAAAAPSATETLAIVKRVGDRWLHVGHRHAHHADIAEALRTPGLAVRHVDGRIEEGQQ